MKALKVFRIPAILALTFIACGDDETPAGPTPNPASPWKVAFQFEASGWGGMGDMWFSGPNDGWACMGPWVFHYDGTKWCLFADLFKELDVSGVYSICAPAPNDVWVSVDLHSRGLIFAHYDGTVWKEVIPPEGGRANDIFFISPTRGWAAVRTGDAGEEKGLVLYYDGRTWTKQWEGDVVFKELYFLGVDNGWAYGFDYNARELGLFHFDGEDWEKVGLPGLKAKTYEAIKFNGPNDGWLLGKSEGNPLLDPLLYHYDGATWTEVKCPPGAKLVNSADFVSATYGWLAGADKTWYYDGLKFTPYPWPYEYEEQFANIVWACGENDVWAAVVSFDKNIIYHFTGFK